MVARDEARRPGRPRLNRETVLRAAVALADQSGTSALTLRKLAERLGVEAMSIYHHLPNKDAILDGMVDLVFAEVELRDDLAWQDALRARAHSLRAALTRHPWAVGLLDSRSNPGPETLRHHDAVIGSLRGGGFTIAGAAHAVAVLDGYIYGFVLQETALPFDVSGESPAALEELADGILTDLPREDLPHLAAMIEHTLQRGYSFAAEFDIGLDLVLDGLAQRRASW